MSLHQFTDDLRNAALTQAQRHASFTTFKQYYDGLCSHILRTKTYTDKELADHIFKPTWSSNLDQTVFKKHLYAGKKTLERFDLLVTPANFDNYKFVLTMLAYDLFDIVNYGEQKFRNTTLNFGMGTRSDQTAFEIFSTASGIFHLGTIDPATAYLREIVPVTTFLLRQAIEVYGKRTLGYSAIKDKAGNGARVGTQIAWDFIEKEVMKSNSRITLPIDIAVVRKVEKWTNAYVHTGLIPDIFIIENAIAMTEGLVFPRNNVANYRGSRRFDGTTQIRDYNAIKSDFEKFIARPKAKNIFKRIWNWFLRLFNLDKKKVYVVEWMDVDKVDATILNL